MVNLARQHFNVPKETRDNLMLGGKLARQGYDWWWHNFTGVNLETGAKKTFFVEFFIINPALSPQKVLFGQAPKTAKPSYLMVKAGSWGQDKAQIHRFFALDEVHQTSSPFIIKAKDCLVSEDQLMGSVNVSAKDAHDHPEWMSDAGQMTWNLQVNKELAFNVGFGASSLMRKLNAFEMYWHVQGLKTKYSGEVIYNGVKYQVFPDTSFGYADKNWGQDFTSPWVWLSSNCLYSTKLKRPLTNSAFDIGGGRPKIFGYGLDRCLLGGMYYEGLECDFNFSKPWLKVKTDFSFHEGEKEVFWQVRQENVSYVMETQLACPKAEMLFINYEAPDGQKRYSKLWNGGTGHGKIKLYQKKGQKLVLLDEILVDHAGCEYGEYDR